MNALTCYECDKRYLRVRSGNGRSAWWGEFRWQGVLSPSITLHWSYSGNWRYPERGEIIMPLFGPVCPAMRITVGHLGAAPVAYDSYSRGCTKSHTLPGLLPGDPEHLANLLSIARSVAAGKAPPDAIPGYIEDRLVEPYCALATDDPIRLFRTLCPIPLLGWSDCYETAGQSSETRVPPEHDPRGPADGDAARADDGRQSP